MRNMGRVIVLVHAPVLGRGSWAGVAAELSRGNRVVVPSLAGFAEAGPPYTSRLVSRVARQVPCGDGDGDGDELVLVAHSGAGVFVPHLLAALAAPAAAAGDEALPGGHATVVFADAALPRQADPGAVVNAEFLPYLRDLASTGVVPPWPQWWPEEELAPLFGDQATREALCGEADPLPLAFFEERLPQLPGGWPRGRAAYLVFSAPYRREAAEAARAGWPVLELPGGHLHMAVRPAEVAAAIMDLTERASSAGSSLRSLP
jgi:Alpha/beta hydrolase family